MNNLKDMVSVGKSVRFTHYQNEALWYSTDCGFAFPVPTQDTGSAIFHSTDKAIIYMRWIRKHIQLIDQAKIDAAKDEHTTLTPSGYCICCGAPKVNGVYQRYEGELGHDPECIWWEPAAKNPEK